MAEVERTNKNKSQTMTNIKMVYRCLVALIHAWPCSRQNAFVGIYLQFNRDRFKRIAEDEAPETTEYKNSQS